MSDTFGGVRHVSNHLFQAFTHYDNDFSFSLNIQRTFHKETSFVIVYQRDKMNLQNFTKEQIAETLTYNQLIPALRKGFQEPYTVPLRHHHNYENKPATDSILLLMPAWKSGAYLGVKVVTVSPENGRVNLPSVQGVYLLFDAATGAPLAQMEAKTLTTIRTAAASALASQFLSRKESTSLLMIGTGNMAPALIEAHAAVRPIKEVYVWGRDFEKAKKLVNEMQLPAINIKAVATISPIIKEVDIISCATLSNDALVKGDWLEPGQHLDLVGSFTPTMRETDDIAIKRASVYVDVLEGATKESGDIVIPLQNGTIQKTDIQGDLFDLCANRVIGRQTDEEITLFKSVGHALEDLVAATLVYKKLTTS